jgi:phosphoribosylanthranilate isomerase
MTRIKICGLTRPEDIEAANQELPDYVGFVFAPSRRQVTPEQARELSSQLDSRIIPVGVFVDEPAELIAQLYDQGTIKIAQLHGPLATSRLPEITDQYPHIPLIIAVAVDDELSLPDLIGQSIGPQDGCSGFESQLTAATLLLDYHTPGSGQTFNWSKLAGLDRPYILAGGINGENIDAALALKPWGIDISSGAETDGKKDSTKIAELVGKVRKNPRHCEEP